MSKQLTLSATAAVLSMAVFALTAGFGGISSDQRGLASGAAPLVELTALR
ncbi:hypothetical protein [Qipengyuania sp.]